jgi:hypothetical protein
VEPTAAGEKLLADNPKCGVSASIEEVSHADGRGLPAGPQARAAHPSARVVAGMGKWAFALSSDDASVAVVDLTTAVYEGEASMAATQTDTKAERTTDEAVAQLTPDEVKKLRARWTKEQKDAGDGGGDDATDDEVEALIAGAIDDADTIELANAANAR